MMIRKIVLLRWLLPGGYDICSTLYYNEQPWHGIDGDTSYSAERSDKDYFIGVQFHPEVAVAKVVDNEQDAGNFMNYEAALAYFKRLIQQTVANKNVAGR